ncbi:MAG TPA: HlyD family efflux transporter periplasmic adaptor subunit [Phycisphaerae bacterium]|nr:HlyD family efflux transporter periplasmic adaptor subunit [Phycisphaerae bacterium]
MSVERVPVSQSQSAVEKSATAELIDRLSRFEGPPEQFLVNLLAVQCQVSGATTGAILRIGADGRPELLAVYPPIRQGAASPTWLAQSVELAPKVISEASTTIRPVHGPDDLYGQPAERQLVVVPLRGGAGVRGVSAFVVDGRDAQALQASRERIELTTSLLSLYEMRLTLQQRQLDLRRLRMALETLSAVNEHERFTGGAMAACNEVSSRWEADRVGIGFLKGRSVYLKAMSHTEKFNRKMKLVQDIEAAMEECLDQDVEVLHPVASQATYVSRAARELSQRHGPTAVLSLPLRKAGEPAAVMTLERPASQPFRLEEVESLRLACELCTPRLVNLYERDRWFGARAAAKLRKGLAKAIGPTHTWVKVAAAAVLAAILFLAFAEGDYTAEGTFVIEPVQQQVVQAPFDGHLVAVDAEPGQAVKQGQLLARLDSEELLSRLVEAQAELFGYQTRMDVARGERKADEMRLAEADAKAVAARIERLEYWIRKAQIVSPIDGTVLRGDWKQQIGASVEAGQVLFEIGPLEALRAELMIPEDQISEVTRDLQRGELATKRHPDLRIAFAVERINPVAEVVDQKNVFKVRVRLVDLDLQGRHAWLRPGMEGIGKIHLGRRPYAWLWTYRLVNWVRMKLWV